EALAYRVGTPIVGDVRYDTPTPTPEVEAVAAPEGLVLYLPGTLPLSGEREDHVTVEHHSSLALAEGTYSLSFVAEDVGGRNALFSKDASGYGEGGHLTALVENGKLKVRFQSTTKSETVQTLSDSIVVGQEYHLAVTFGPDGFWLYLDGALQDWETDFFQTMELNAEDLLIGANGWGSTSSDPDWARDHFEGVISEFTVFDQQMTRAEVRELAGLQPPVDPTDPFIDNGVLYGTLAGETLDLNQYPDVKTAVGYYGDDVILGSDDGVVLFGGHGEDRLVGGAGNDILYSFADGREPRIYQDYDPAQDDPDGEIDPETRTHFPGQPIEADDVLRGGGGADTFHFRTLINAKRDIILKHVRDDRTIHWHGVAGENNDVHDHWAERFGNEVIEDFNREEGDHIEIVGHTIDVERVRHVDLNGDGVIESTVIYVQSNQGNAGAHNRDKLGTITALNALLTRSDYTVNAAPAYGIVDTIDELDEALAYRVGTPIVGDVHYDTPTPTPEVEAAEGPEGSVIFLDEALDFSGESGDHIDIAHIQSLELDEGTYATQFTAEDVNRRRTLFSKDASGYEDGGHLTAFVERGRVKVRFQSDSRSVWLTSSSNSILEGEEYHLAFSFGANGARLYLNGELVDEESGFTQGMALNTNSLLVAANGWSRSESNPNTARDRFVGVISDFTVFDSQLSDAAIDTLANGGGAGGSDFFEDSDESEDSDNATDEFFSEMGTMF
ncbi:MAG: LamG-like jellyroll fold domain-containing protein, partial [Planctomycetota bacterium]